MLVACATRIPSFMVIIGYSLRYHLLGIWTLSTVGQLPLIYRNKSENLKPKIIY